MHLTQHEPAIDVSGWEKHNNSCLLVIHYNDILIPPDDFYDNTFTCGQRFLAAERALRIIEANHFRAWNAESLEIISNLCVEAGPRLAHAALMRGPQDDDEIPF